MLPLSHNKTFLVYLWLRKDSNDCVLTYSSCYILVVFKVLGVSFIKFDSEASGRL